jgi:ABC-type nickel/cobalt efflux system permease component RcnA
LTLQRRRAFDALGVGVGFLLRVVGGCLAATLLTAVAAQAHPLGNFTVNHLSRITAVRGAIDVRYVLDMAEIPSFSLDRSLDDRGTPSHDELQAWADGHARAIAGDLVLTIDGRPAPLVPLGATIAHRPGAGGLPTTYFTAQYSAAVSPGAHRITYTDRSEPGRLGWKDVVLGRATEPTHELRVYPNALLGSPATRTQIAAQLTPGGALIAIAGNEDPSAADGAALGAAPIAALGRMNALSDVLAHGAHDPLVIIGALLLAVALGALHALEPGHGKTLLAVSLVGARATRKQALILASALTVAHTAGVLALGLIVLAALPQVATEQIYPWITLGSGIFVTILGARAVAREVRRNLPIAHVHEHAHPHAHPHDHVHVHALGAGHEHTHDHLLDDEEHARAHAIPGSAPLTFRSAVLAAMSGNIAPCPAAFVVLLAAIQLHQVAYGLALIVAFSLGLAAVLTVLGVAVVRGASWLVARPQFDRVARWAPLLTAAVIASVGAAMIGQGFVAQGLGIPIPATVGLVLVAVVGYAFAWHGHRSPHGAHA